MKRQNAEGFSDDAAGARALLEGPTVHLDEACIGTISKIADAESPCTPRGSISQAWVKSATDREND